METKNKLLIAAAGSGKTQYIIENAFEIIKKNPESKILITTYTKNNSEEIRNRIKEHNFKEFKDYSIPKNVVVQEWFSFLLEHGVKPFKSLIKKELLYKNIGFNLCCGKSGLKYEYFNKILKRNIPVYYAEDDFFNYYFDKNFSIYSDKISKFIIQVNKVSTGSVIERLENIYTHILIDEVQDIAGWGLEILKTFLKSRIKIEMVGDPRQTIYLTEDTDKYKKYNNGRIVDFLKNECKKITIDIDTTSLSVSHRFNNEIAKFSSSIFPDLPEVKECACCDHKNNHTGVYIIKSSDVGNYLNKYPETKILRYKNSGPGEVNIGISKGSTYARCIIFPTSPKSEIFNFLQNKSFKKFDEHKFYVALTRAKHSVAIVYDYKEGETFKPGIIYCNTLDNAHT